MYPQATLRGKGVPIDKNIRSIIVNFMALGAVDICRYYVVYQKSRWYGLRWLSPSRWLFFVHNRAGCSISIGTGVKWPWLWTMQTNQLIERNGEPVVWIEIGAGNEAPRRANPWKDSLLFLLFLFGVKHSSPESIVEKGMLQLHSTKDTGTTRVSRTSTARRKRGFSLRNATWRLTRCFRHPLYSNRLNNASFPNNPPSSSCPAAKADFLLLRRFPIGVQYRTSCMYTISFICFSSLICVFFFIWQRSDITYRT